MLVIVQLPDGAINVTAESVPANTGQNLNPLNRPKQVLKQYSVHLKEFKLKIFIVLKNIYCKCI